MKPMSSSEYNVAVFGVPLSYYAEDPKADRPEEMTDEEWCEHHGILPETYPDESESSAMTGHINTETTDDLIYLTDDRGRAVYDTEDLTEPNPGSVVLTDGDFGTAWQRHFSDGKWHSSLGGRPVTWAWLLRRKRNLRLAYDAPIRPNPEV